MWEKKNTEIERDCFGLWVVQGPRGCSTAVFMQGQGQSQSHLLKTWRSPELPQPVLGGNSKVFWDLAFHFYLAHQMYFEKQLQAAGKSCFPPLASFIHPHFKREKWVTRGEVGDQGYKLPNTHTHIFGFPGSSFPAAAEGTALLPWDPSTATTIRATPSPPAALGATSAHPRAGGCPAVATLTPERALPYSSLLFSILPLCTLRPVHLFP